jgi:predicted anti-sigma-YlaC factor YlaD
MDCATIREAASAALDGEAPGIDQAAIAAHVATCAACRAFVDHAQALRAANLAAVGQPPDVSARVLTQARRERRLHSPSTQVLRLGLVAVALAQLLMAVPGLIYGTDEGAPIHIAHEVGAWDLALAVGFVFAAWRPLRAVGLLPFAAALSAGLILTAVVDVAHGRAVALTETTHLLELVGTAFLWLLVAPRAAMRSQPELRVV